MSICESVVFSLMPDVFVTILLMITYHTLETGSISSVVSSFSLKHLCAVLLYSAVLRIEITSNLHGVEVLITT